MSDSKLVGLFMLGGGFVVAFIVLLVARLVDRLRGVSPEESKTMGVMAYRGSTESPFGVRELDGGEPMESPYTSDWKPGSRVE